ncbi:MAG: hypothetical protein RIS76_83 [Verrucomicrobiota bacterium]
MNLWRTLLAGSTGLLVCAAAPVTPATFRMPATVRFLPESNPEPAGLRVASSPPSPPSPSIVAHPEEAPDERWEFTDRVVLALAPEIAVESLLDSSPLKLDRTLRPGLYVLQASDAGEAWRACAEWAGREGVLAAHPVAHPPWVAHDAYAAAPNDEFFRVARGNDPGQWSLENRDPETGRELGADINIRPAWAVSRGEGITVGVADSGVQLDHLDLADRTAGAPHFNFAKGTNDGSPFLRNSLGAHGTSCAGLIAATGNNHWGMSGVAPASRIASWVIWERGPAAGQPPRTITDERLGDVFRYASNTVAIQNHSWGPSGPLQRGPSVLEDAGIEDAWRQGRGGLGTVMVRAAGNERGQGAQAGDDGFANDPRVLCVAAVRTNGQPSSFSEPGACVLVAAPAGDVTEGGLFTTDLPGTSGANFVSFFPPFEYLSDFRWGALGFTGTSAAAPLVSGVAALILATRPLLTARDVQQVMLLSARHFDTSDPGLARNRAGLLFSHNLGFGIVDAGEAVRWAALWSNRPPAVEVSVDAEGSTPIPDAGFRMELQAGAADNLPLVVSGLPGTGVHPEIATAFLPLVDLGKALEDPPTRLDGKGALIERGGSPYAEKLARVAAAGAAFAVVFNADAAEIPGGSCPGGEQLCVLTGTDYSAIPAIFIRRSDGLAVRAAVEANPQRAARIHLEGAVRQFSVTRDLQCEHVGVRLRTDHTGRGDLRVTLRSPTGTVSVLQRYNADTTAGPSDWTYWSTQHFFEPSAGTWELRVTDQAGGEGLGQILGATLLVRGVPVEDTDRDGLDDAWEQSRLGGLGQGPAGDSDADGISNLREFLAGSDPLRDEGSASPDIGFFSETLVRVSWPGREASGYTLESGTTPGDWGSVTAVPGRFPVTTAILPTPAEGTGYFRVKPAP